MTALRDLFGQDVYTDDNAVVLVDGDQSNAASLWPTGKPDELLVQFVDNRPDQVIKVEGAGPEPHEAMSKVPFTAAEVIVFAARKSGLLKEVAEALCFIDKDNTVDTAIAGFRVDAIIDGLADEFDECTCTAGITHAPRRFSSSLTVRPLPQSSGHSDAR